MTTPNLEDSAARLIPPLRTLRAQMLEFEQKLDAELARIEPRLQPSARNLVHYLSLRQHDIRQLQQDLANLGLSSLGVVEGHTLASLNAVIDVLERLSATPPEAAPEAPVPLHSGHERLREHTRALLGADPDNRNVRVMVTMPSEAAHDERLIQDLLLAGMDVMRINCAHDGPKEWMAMATNLRRAERATGRHCRIQADLAGPKLRTGPLAPVGHFLRLKPKRDSTGSVIAPARLWITAEEVPQAPPPGIRQRAYLPEATLVQLRAGDTLHLKDLSGRRRRLEIVERRPGGCLLECDRSVYLSAGAAFAVRRDGDPLLDGHFGPLPEVIEPLLLLPGDTLVLTRAAEPGLAAKRDANGHLLEPARVHCTLETAFEHVRPGERVWLDDGSIGGTVVGSDGEQILVEITHTGPAGSKLRPEKGINFPDSKMPLSALTPKDIEDLAEVVGFVDMIALSFLHGPEDVVQLEEELCRLNAEQTGIVLKIENRAAFEQLPRILLTSLRSPPVGVMVARGDLAVEMGFDRLSEVQEEILWLCEAAHIPVIWATQVLESLAKKGAPSRAEISDAVMSSRAECVMLNKGSNIVEAVQFLSALLERMAPHHSKRMALLRRLAVSEFAIR